MNETEIRAEHMNIPAKAEGSGFMDYANQIRTRPLFPLFPSGDMTLKLHWESADKRWNVEGYAASLFKRDVENLVGMHLIVRY